MLMKHASELPAAVWMTDFVVICVVLCCALRGMVNEFVPYMMLFCVAQLYYGKEGAGGILLLLAKITSNQPSLAKFASKIPLAKFASTYPPNGLCQQHTSLAKFASSIPPTTLANLRHHQDTKMLRNE